jgi:hypothetical protein
VRREARQKRRSAKAEATRKWREWARTAGPAHPYVDADEAAERSHCLRERTHGCAPPLILSPETYTLMEEMYERYPHP